MKYEIKKDIYLNCWIVWEIHQNYKVDRCQAPTKRECKQFIENVKKCK